MSRLRITSSTTLTALVAVLLTPSTGALSAQAAQTAASTAPRTTQEALKQHVRFLASPERGGRMTGSADEAEAAHYLAAELAAMGVEPLDGENDMLIDFEFTAGSKDSGTSLSLLDPPRAAADSVAWNNTSQVQALSFSDAATVSGDLVFVGYGLKIPEGQDFPYDSYAGLDVEGKIVLVLRYFPEEADQDARAVLSRYSGLRYKALQAREQGAVGMLVVAGPNSPNAGEVIPMSFDTAISGSGIAAASLSGEAADALFQAAQKTGSYKSLKEAQAALDTANPHITGFALEGLQVKLDVRIERQRQVAHNVVGWLPQTESTDQPRAAIVLGAHYDHLGSGDGGNSLARKQEAGLPHLGADDNASGVAAVLEIGHRLANMKRPRPVVLGFWTGEELGLLGSTEFVKDEPLGPGNTAAYVNFDMVGRVRDNRLSLQAVGSSPVWPQLIERSNVPVGFDLQLQQDPYLPTDSSAFNQQEIPTLNFFSGSHDDYHRPTDSSDKLNYEDLERVVDLGALIASKLVAQQEDPEFTVVERQRAAGGDRDTLRAYTGTIPDYTTEVEGLLLGGVMEGGPAEEAGLLAGDLIIEFAGQSITNIYDYTYALDAVKVDVPVTVVVLRNGERVEVEMTPRARD